MDTSIIYWSLAEIAKKYRVNRVTLCSDIAAGRLAATKYRGKYYVTPDEVERWAVQYATGTTRENGSGRKRGGAAKDAVEKARQYGKQYYAERRQQKKADYIRSVRHFHHLDS